MSEQQRVRAETIRRLRAAGCVFAEQEADLLLEAAPDGPDLERLLQQRVDGLPLEHVLGWAEFGGLRIAIGPGVFVPRRRTEFLAQAALERVRLGRDRGRDREPVVVDLCCGAGALGAVLVAAEPGVALYAADIDENAVVYAEQNLRGTGAVARRGDLFDALPRELRGQVDVVVVNLPYVPTAAIDLLPPEFRMHEPRLSLDGGADGLDVFRRVIPEVGAWLQPGGCLLVELEADQIAPAAELASRAGLATEVLQDREPDDPAAEVFVLVASRWISAPEARGRAGSVPIRRAGSVTTRPAG